jgi:hypothetical protein
MNIQKGWMLDAEVSAGAAGTSYQEFLLTDGTQKRTVGNVQKYAGRFELEGFVM